MLFIYLPPKKTRQIYNVLRRGDGGTADKRTTLQNTCVRTATRAASECGLKKPDSERVNWGGSPRPAYPRGIIHARSMTPPRGRFLCIFSYRAKGQRRDQPPEYCRIFPCAVCPAVGHTRRQGGWRGKRVVGSKMDNVVPNADRENVGG